MAPTITSGATAIAIDENSGASQVIYTASSTDTGDVTTGNTAYSLKATGDASLFSIDAGTGAVTLIANPDFEAKSGYSFTVVATDAAGNASEQAVSLAINNLDEVAPTIISGATAIAIDENSGAAQTIYTATSTDTGDVATGNTAYSLKATGDASLFSIDASTGAVTLIANPDFEAQSGYSFTVVATDAAGNASEQAVSLAINDLDELAPQITSGATAIAIDENSGAAQIIYTATSTDTGDVATGNTVYSLKATGDASLFSIDASTGAVTLIANPDFEAKPGYSFTVVATDAAGNASEQAVSLVIHNLDEVAPTITSGATAIAIDENSGAAQTVYTATSTDTGDVAIGNTAYSLKATGDASLFSIDASTGAVTLIANPDFEAKSSYSFTVVATDAAGNASEQVVSLVIHNLDEVAPTITSGATAIAIDENSGAAQSIYTASSTDTGDVATGNTAYSLKATGDASFFSMNASTGAVTLIANPDFEAQSSYSFTVVAADAAGNASEQAVSLVIYNLDELAPQITSGATAVAQVRPGGGSQQVYTASAVDVGDDSVGIRRFSLKPGSDPALQIDAVTGVLVMTEQPQRRPYVFTLVATDAVGNRSEQRCELRIKMVGAGLLPYDAAREIEVISADNGSVRYVLQGERVMLDATQLALAAQTLMGAAPALAAPPLERQATPLRDLVQWALSEPVSVGIAARIEALAAMAAPEPSASAQMLATPEFLSMRSPSAESTPSASPQATEPVPATAPATAPAPAAEPTSPAVPTGPAVPILPLSPNAPAAPGAPSVRQEAPSSGQAPVPVHAGQKRSADAAVDSANPMALRWGSMLADVYAMLKSIATGSRPAPVTEPVPEAARQAPPQAGSSASTQESSSRGGAAAPGA